MDAALPVAGSSPSDVPAVPTDPFQFLSQYIQRAVAVTLLPRDAADPHDGGAVVTGILVSVDDLCNVLVRGWTCTDTVSVAAAAAAAGSGSAEQTRKKARTETHDGGEEVESLRLIRGAQIASISLLA